MSVANDVLAWSMDRRKRRERVEDQESQNSFALTSMREQGKLNEEAADKASKRRIEEAKEANRLQTYHKAKQLGVEGISIDDPQAKLDDAILEKSRQINRGILEGYKAQKKANLRDIKEAESKYYADVRKNGSPEQIRTAIMNIYNNASLTAGLSDKQKQMIRDAADPKKSTDPAAAMQKAVDAIRDTHGWTTFDSTEAKRASDIFSAFDEQRGAIVDADKKSTLPVIAEQIHSAYQSDREFNKSIVTQIPALTSILSDKEQKQYLGKQSIASLFSGMLGNDGVVAAPGTAPGTAPVVSAKPEDTKPTPPQPQTNSPVSPIGDPREIMKSWPVPKTNDFSDPNFRPTLPPGPSFDKKNDQLHFPPQSSNIGEKLREMVKQDTIASFRQNPNPRPIAATPEEINEAHQLNSSIISPGQGHHLIALLNSDVPSERSFGIAAVNSLIRAVRMTSSGSLPPITVPG